MSKRPSYKEAIAWIACNDDTDWIGEDPSDDEPISVTAALVGDLFDKPYSKVTNDLRKALGRGRK